MELIIFYIIECVMVKKRFCYFVLFLLMLIVPSFSQEENPDDSNEEEITFKQEDIYETRKTYADYFLEELKEQIETATDEDTMVFSFFSAGPYMMSNEMKTTGIGFSIEYERQVVSHIALKSRTKFSTFLTGFSDLKCLTAYTSVFIDYYPMSQQLKKLYVGLGGSVEGFVYLNSVTEIEGSDKTGWVFAISPEVGYKMTAAYGTIIDMYVGYKWTYPINTYFYGSTKDFFGDNLIYGFKIHFPIKLVQLIKRPYDRQKEESNTSSSD